jgi:hypothetical protein
VPELPVMTQLEHDGPMRMLVLTLAIPLELTMEFATEANSKIPKLFADPELYPTIVFPTIDMWFAAETTIPADAVPNSLSRLTPLLR